MMALTGMVNIDSINNAYGYMSAAVESLQHLDGVHNFLDYIYCRNREFDHLKECLESRGFYPCSDLSSREEQVRDVVKVAEAVLSRFDTISKMKEAANKLRFDLRENSVALLTGLEALEEIREETKDIFEKHVKPQQEESDDGTETTQKEETTLQLQLRSQAMEEEPGKFCYPEDLTLLKIFKELSSLQSIEKCPVKNTSPLGNLTHTYSTSQYALDTYFTVGGNTQGCAFLYPPEYSSIYDSDSSAKSIKKKIGDLNKRGVGHVIARWQLSSSLLEKGFLVLYSPAVINFPITCALMRGEDFNPVLEGNEIELTCSIRDKHFGDPVKFTPGRDVIGLRENSNHLLVIFRHHEKLRRVNFKVKSNIVDFALDRVSNTGEHKHLMVIILLKNNGIVCYKLDEQGTTIKTVNHSLGTSQTEYTSILTGIHKNGNNMVFLTGLRPTQSNSTEYVPVVSAFSLTQKSSADIIIEPVALSEHTSSDIQDRAFSCIPKKSSSGVNMSVSRITTAIISQDENESGSTVFTVAVCYPWISKIVMTVILMQKSPVSSPDGNICCFEVIEPSRQPSEAVDIRVQTVAYLYELKAKPKKSAIAIIEKRPLIGETTMQEANCGSILHFGK